MTKKVDFKFIILFIVITLFILGLKTTNRYNKNKELKISHQKDSTIEALNKEILILKFKKDSLIEELSECDKDIQEKERETY